MDQHKRHFLKARTVILPTMLAVSGVIFSSNISAKPMALRCIMDFSQEVHEMVVDIDRKSVRHDIGFDAPVSRFNKARKISLPLSVSEDQVSYQYQMEPDGVALTHSYTIIRSTLEVIFKESFSLENQVSVNTHKGSCQALKNKK